jgi:iron complex transport system ATP-binding protein
MDAQDPILSLSKLSLAYPDGPQLIEDASGIALKGEMIAVVGRNGSGKSTLLRTITGLQKPFHGKIEWHGKALEHYHLAELSRRVTFVGTSNLLLQNLTVFELVSMGRHPHTNWWGALRAHDREKILESIDFVGMSDFTEVKIDRLSDGERQRAVIAMALAQQTEVIILDEPTAFLDIPNKIAIAEVLYRLKSAGHTIIYSTHDFDNVFSYADKLWVIHNKQLYQGSPEDLGMKNLFDKLFESSGIIFSQEMLGFYQKRKGEKKIYLNPGSDREVLFWTSRALERIGYEVLSSPEKDSDHVIVENTKGDLRWNLNTGNTTLHFSTLYDMCSHLTKD